LKFFKLEFRIFEYSEILGGVKMFMVEFSIL
jgi:hypothetical protein